MSTNFGFLQPEWPQIYESALKAEAFAVPDPNTACFHARRTLELVMQWLYKSDDRLHLPYQGNLSALIHEPTFHQVAGPGIQTKADLINRIGNRAVHADTRGVTKENAVAVVRDLFHITFWMARTYAQGTKPADSLQFLAILLPTTSPLPPATKAKLQELEAALGTKDAQLAEQVNNQAAMDAELQALRAQIAEARKLNEAIPDTHDYTEAETRDSFIDLLLAESGWPLKQPQDREYEVTGMPSSSGTGYVDYVLWGKDGRPLGLVEAKRTRKSPQAGQQQAKLYADCLEAKFGQRPVIFYTNGYEHWIWDDLQYPPRQVSGFYTASELELLIQRRTSRLALESVATDKAIAERYYQERAIRNIARVFEQEHQRKALLVMATGSGKTRTVIALTDVLMRANWAKRILFLADRVALVKQAAREYNKNLPGSSPVNLVSEKNEDGRIYISTYPTMMGLINEVKGGTRRFGPGYFDLIVVDEAHRSIYQKYGAIFDYFDALLVGLTATPRNEIDRNTYGLFALERGVPTDEYGLADAVADGWLVPSENIAIPLKFPREGIKYDDLTPEEREEWEEQEWADDGTVPAAVEPGAVNQWLFNESTVDLVLQHLMERGLKVANGDRLGKTIVFAKNHDHAEYIVERFNHHYPHLKGGFARVIDFKVDYAQSLIDAFSQSEKAPHIAVSVDMLDTGIDVPEVLNLAFVKVVRSKTKFWQMVGRGTRLRENLFGPSKDKKFFRIFDYCGNLEYFSVNPDAAESRLPDSISKRLFTHRVELIAELDKLTLDAQECERALRRELAEFLRIEVAGMHLDNFIVRPKRRFVERYTEASPWEKLSPEAVMELTGEVAGLPSSVTDDDQDAKQFDLLMLRMQLTLLRHEPGFDRMQAQVMSIASLLEEKAAIPMVAAQLKLLHEMQTDEFWTDIQVVQLEAVRKRLRSLVKLIERTRRNIVYTAFEDELGEEGVVALPDVPVGVDIERLRAKTRDFLKKHEQAVVVQKLKWNEPLNSDDLASLEAIFLAEGTSTAGIGEAKRISDGLGLFVRSVVGLDRIAAKRAFESFLATRTLSVSQIKFVEIIIEHLSRAGFVQVRDLYASPFVDLHPSGVDGLFDQAAVQQMLSILTAVRMNAQSEGVL